MVFPSSSYDVFSLFDTTYTLSTGAMKRAFAIIDHGVHYRCQTLGKTRIVKDGCFRLSIQLSNFMCITDC